jgi:hypothetical protein
MQAVHFRSAPQRLHANVECGRVAPAASVVNIKNRPVYNIKNRPVYDPFRPVYGWWLDLQSHYDLELAADRAEARIARTVKPCPLLPGPVAVPA